MSGEASEQERLSDLPRAQVRTRPRGLHLSMVWLLPLVAALIGLWVVYTDWTDRGPLVTIYFSNAEGIEAKKTRVKYRDVAVGLVEEVHFSDDMSRVVTKVRLDKAFSGRITDATRFWVVRPRVEGLRISGLETLISGAYISMDLGAGGEPADVFEGLDEPSSVLSDTPGTFFKLRAEGLGSLSSGSPVYFRQIDVGEVVKYRLAPDSSHVEIDVFIRAPHDERVRVNTRFWNVSGVELDLSAAGLQVGLESLASLLAGGIAFATPQSLDAGAQAQPGASFPLYASRDASKEAPITISQPYVLHFPDTIRGLSVGAPVEFRGLRVGTVSDIGFEGNAEAGPVRTPVLISIEPERVPMADPGEGGEFELLDAETQRARVRALLERSVQAGLRARLQTGNLLTGQMFVELDFVAEAEPAAVDYSGEIPEMPTVPGVFDGITRNLSRILAKIDRLPLEQIGRDLQATMAGANALVNSAELKNSLSHVEQSLQKLDGLLAVLEQKSGPLMDTVEQTGQDIRGLITASEGAVTRAEAALASVEKTVSADGPLGRELLAALEELTAAARSIRIMAEYLERHPEALIKGKANY